MFTLDEKLRTINATREQILSLHQSLNSPHLAIPGKQAGPAQAFIVVVRGPADFSVYVYLYLADGPDCAIYVPKQRSVPKEKYRAQEEEALAFVESMGFMMDPINFQGLNAAAQVELLRTLPLFKRDLQPSAPAPQAEAKPVSALAKVIGRILSSF
ncbi:MAG TPA: social motility and stimulation tgl protein [Myxococcaceae bacterium]|nr:social motility and stimulation tgl protein [Myxococcaceae bacterium]